MGTTTGINASADIASSNGIRRRRGKQWIQSSPLGHFIRSYTCSCWSMHVFIHEACQGKAKEAQEAERRCGDISNVFLLRSLGLLPDDTANRPSVAATSAAVLLQAARNYAIDEWETGCGNAFATPWTRRISSVTEFSFVVNVGK